MPNKVNKGSCLCGAVTINAAISPNVGVCHCSMCRKWSGGSYLAVEATGEVSFTGEDNINRYKSSDWARRGFCKTCGTHLFYHLLDKDQYIVSAGLFSDDTSFILEHQIFIEEKPHYYSFAEKTKNMTGAEVFAQFESENG